MYKKIITLFNYRLMAFFTVLVTVFLSICLATYSPVDPSGFYYTTRTEIIHNQMGIVGSYVSSTLLYLLGGSAYLLIAFGLYFFWATASRVSLRDEWERLIAFSLLICATALMQSMYATDLVFNANTGGLLGQSIYGQLAFMDPILIASLGITTVWISLILITRIAFIPVVHHGLRAVSYTFAVTARLLAPITRPLTYRIARVREWVSIQINDQVVGMKQKIFGIQPAKTYEPPTFTSFSESPEPVSDIYPSYEQSPKSSHSFETASTNFEAPAPSVSEPHNAIEDVSSNFIEVVPVEHYQEPVAVVPTPEPLKSYELPPNRLFTPPVNTLLDQRSQDEVQARARILEEKLECFGIAGSVVSIKHGPVVTLFEYQPAINTKISKIMSLEDDLALALQALSIRIIAPVPGTPYVGFEVANKDRKNVSYAALARSEKFRSWEGSLPLILGENTVGNTKIVDLASMPHLLIAGSTGSGKSVALNTMLISLLCKCTPEQLRMILIDPKRLEFASYADLPHLLFPIITESKKSIAALKWVVQTMEERYEQLAQAGVRNIFDYNKMRKMNNEQELPFIVVVIDELADLMMTTGKEIEDLIVRVAQMARASGIHMILATQRPSVDVITGLIKVNFPSRISCRVTSKVDSRTILDSSGAEKLLGKGDMLFLNSNSAALERVHGAYISDNEIQEIANHIRLQRPPKYIDLNPMLSTKTDMMHDADDELYQEILTFLETIDEISISLLQRRFRIGYNRSARIIDILESQGHITMSEGSRTRKVVR